MKRYAVRDSVDERNIFIWADSAEAAAREHVLAHQSRNVPVHVFVTNDRAEMTMWETTEPPLCVVHLESRDG